MKDNRTKMLVEGGIMIALAYVLSLVKIYELPNGGSVTAVSMLPMVVFAIRWGAGPGVFVAGVYGVIQFILGPKWSFHWVSILCDYILGFGVLGLAGIFGKNLIQSTLGIALGVSLRFVAAVISGVVVFASYAPAGQDPLLYSVIYNASYLVPEMVITVVAYWVMFKPLQRLERERA